MLSVIWTVTWRLPERASSRLPVLLSPTVSVRVLPARIVADVLPTLVLCRAPPTLSRTVVRQPPESLAQPSLTVTAPALADGRPFRLRLDFTPSVSFREVERAKLESPEYVAWIVCLPGALYVERQLAVPVEALTRADLQPDSVERPSVNLTVPPPGTGAIVAVYVTPWPVTDGFAEDLSAVVVELVRTTCVSAAAWDPL
jgi:hypothetical protein